MSRRLDLKALLVTVLAAAGLGSGLFVADSAQRLRGAEQAQRGPGPLVQKAPEVVVLDKVTSRRRFSGPTDLVERVVDAPETGSVSTITDRLRREGGNVVLDRVVVRRVERPVVLLRSSLDAAFEVKGDRFNHAFGGLYEWENPNDAPSPMKFTFSPASRGRTVRDLQVSVNGRPIENPKGKSGAYVWYGVVPPRGRVSANVGYRTEGIESYAYVPGTTPIGRLEFRMRSNRTPVIAEESLTRSQSSDGTASWLLNDVRADAAIEFGFSSALIGVEARERALAFAPAALLLFAAGAWLIRSERALAATIAFAAGLAGMIALHTYLPPVGSVLVGGALAGIVGGAALGSRRGAFAGLAGALIALAAALPEHFPLLLWGIGLLVLGPTVIRRPREVPLPKRAYVS